MCMVPQKGAEWLAADKDDRRQRVRGTTNGSIDTGWLCWWWWRRYGDNDITCCRLGVNQSQFHWNVCYLQREIIYLLSSPVVQQLNGKSVDNCGFSVRCTCPWKLCYNIRQMANIWTSWAENLWKHLLLGFTCLLLLLLCVHTLKPLLEVQLCVYGGVKGTAD